MESYSKTEFIELKSYMRTLNKAHYDWSLDFDVFQVLFNKLINHLNAEQLTELLRSLTRPAPWSIDKNIQCTEINTARELLLQGADAKGVCPITYDEYEKVPTELKTEVCSLLLKNGASPNIRNREGGLPIYCTSSVGTASVLLKYGANPTDGIHHQSSSSIMKTIIEAGADVDALDRGNKTPLMSLWPGTESVNAKLLLEAGANPNIENQKGKTAIFYTGNSKVIQLLNKFGADINHKDKKGNVALFNNYEIPSNPNSITALVKSGLSINEIGPRLNHFLIHTATFWGEDDCFKCTQKALINGADPNIKLKDDATPLMLWASGIHPYNLRCNRKIVDLFLKHGGDIHQTDRSGLDALMYAFKNHNQRCIKLLLSKKPDLNRVSKNKLNALGWTFFQKDSVPETKLIDALLDANVDINNTHTPKNYKYNALGKFINAEDYIYCLKLMNRGALVNHSTLATLGVTLNEIMAIHKVAEDKSGSNPQINKLIELSKLDPKLFQSSIDQESNKFAKILSELVPGCEADESNNDSPLNLLEPENWPPKLFDRKPISVENIPVLTYSPTLSWNDGEYDVFINSLNRYPSLKPPAKTIIQTSQNKIIKEIMTLLEQNKKIALKKSIGLSNSAFISLWNSQIVKITELLRRTDRLAFFKYILARYGVDVVPGLIRIAAKEPQILTILNPVNDPRVAVLMASALTKPSTEIFAKKWFKRHIEAALHGLIPLAVSSLSTTRSTCEFTLRYLAATGYKQTITKYSSSYNVTIEKSVAEILHDLRQNYLGKKLPNISSSLLKPGVSKPQITDTNQEIPNRFLPALFGMMSLSTYDAPYPDISELKHYLTADSLADFSWSVYTQPNSHRWAFHSLAYFGNDKTVRLLASEILKWPRYNLLKDIELGLNILKIIGSNYAISTICSIKTKTKYWKLISATTNILNEIAEEKGLTVTQLEDQLVPTLMTEDPSTLILNFGPRTFTIVIDEKLKPTLIDESGKVIKTLPRPRKSDDPVKAKSATKHWREFRASLKSEAKTQLARFETAMISDRKWTATDFQNLMVKHPLLQYLVRQLIWAEYTNGKLTNTFMVSEDGSFFTSNGKPLELDNSVQISIPHPLRIKRQIRKWLEYLAQHKIKQPFAQIARHCFVRKDDKNNDLFGIDGATIQSGSLRGLSAKGWVPVLAGFAELIDCWSKGLRSGSVDIETDGAVFLTDVAASDKEILIRISLPNKISAIEFSEIVRELKELL